MQKFIQLSKDDGSWDDLCHNWRTQCEEFEEEFEDFAIAPMSVIRPLIESPEQRAGVYATVLDNHFTSICHINVAMLPKYDGPVLRMRHLTMSPRIDYGENTISTYADVIANNFLGTLDLSNKDGFMKSDHLKYHLRSPADHDFFTILGQHLSRLAQFETVQKAGSWLYVSKKRI